MPVLCKKTNPTEIRNELAMAVISHHAVTRHQNQRSRYNKPVPAPTCNMMLKLSCADSSTNTSDEESTNSTTVANRPART